MTKKTVLITGSSTGFGHAVAGLFADHGWKCCRHAQGSGRTNAALGERMATPAHNAAVIYGAVAVGTKRLRDLGSDDVKYFVEARRKLSDEDYENYMRAPFA